MCLEPRHTHVLGSCPHPSHGVLGSLLVASLDTHPVHVDIREGSESQGPEDPTRKRLTPTGAPSPLEM